MQSSPDIIERLGNLEIFSDFAADTVENKRILEEVCSILESKNFSAGDVIIGEGQLGDSLYILAEGSVQILRKTLHNEQFAVINLSAAQNIFFGEMGLINQDKRSASVIAFTNCKTLMITRHDFIKLCEKEPLLGYKSLFRIAKRLVDFLRKANGDVITLYQALLDEVGEIE